MTIKRGGGDPRSPEEKAADEAVLTEAHRIAHIAHIHVRELAVEDVPSLPAFREVLAQEAADWDSRRLTPAGFEDAPEAIPSVARAPAVPWSEVVHIMSCIKILYRQGAIADDNLARLRKLMCWCPWCSRKMAGDECGCP